MEKVCLVIGAGAGIGGTVASRFAAGGFHAVLCRRSDLAGLDRSVDDIRAAGGKATGRQLNAVEPDSIETLITEVERDIGPIHTLVYNIGAQVGDRALEETDHKVFERCWRMSVFGLFRAAQAVCPLMAERGDGALLVTASTAAMRGNPGQHAHASAMAARRMLCQSLNAEYAAQGVHVVHIVVDGTVDAPDTLGKMLGPERFQALREEKGATDGLVLPAQLAETYWYLAHQHRSAWTHELDIRAWSDQAWWNHRTSTQI
jgi:NAD(P)-dependent dehydrogenase (short-subunit alcohol dehydrogenase family)